MQMKSHLKITLHLAKVIKKAISIGLTKLKESKLERRELKKLLTSVNKI